MNLLEYCIGLSESPSENLLRSLWRLIAGAPEKAIPPIQLMSGSPPANWAERKAAS